MHVGRKTVSRTSRSAAARASVRGSAEYPTLYGTVTFKQMKNGVLVTAEVFGLPTSGEKCSGGVFGFHIHEGTQCSGNENDPFADAKGHFNPDGCPHPHHAGDLPPLFGNNGYAYMSVFTNRFRVDQIIGRVVIIHGGADDFKTQPSGDSGMKIACGKIVYA